CSSVEFCSRGLLCRCPDGLHFEIDVDAIADEDAAGLEHLIPGETEVLSVERRLCGEPDALVTPRISGAIAVLDVEGDLACDVPDREVSEYTVVSVVESFDSLASKSELGKRLHVEEVG